jgi:hypothetical protein
VIYRMAEYLTQGQQSRHISAGLVGQLEGPEIGGLAPFFITPDGVPDRTRTRVVGGQRQLPITVKLLIEAFQVVQGGTG